MNWTRDKKKVTGREHPVTFLTWDGTNYMNAAKYSILITLFSILNKGKKHYIVPSADAILSLLEKYHKINIKRRWFFYCMKYLKEQGYIVTKYRFDHYDGKKIMQLPSMITFTLKGASCLMKKQVVGAKALLKTILKWIGKGDRRFPKPQEFDYKMSDEDKEANKARLKELLDFL